MHEFRSERRVGIRMRVLPIVALAVGLLPGSSAAQVRDVISKEIAVARSEAGLSLEVEGGRELDIAFRDGTVLIDGDDAGRFEPGGTLEGAWRGLLGTAVALDDGPLARALVDWEPPEGLDGRSLALARRIDAALEAALVAPGSDRAEPAPDPAPDVVVRALLERTDRLGELAEAMAGLRIDDVVIRIGEDVVIERGVQLDATLVAVDSDVEVEGTVRGDVVVVDGTLRVADEGRIEGDVRLAGSRLLERDGEIEGRVVEVSVADVRGEEDLRDRIREELRDDLRRELREEIRSATRLRGGDDDGWALLRPFRSLGRGLAGIIGVVLNTAILALLGWGVVFFAGDNLSVVAETARRSPGRSAVVGMAGIFLLLPVWVLGGLALIITVVGIFALPFWIALFPLAVAASAGLGFFAVASGIGEHLARRRYPFLDWVRSSNAYTLVTGGLVVLATPFLAANVVEMAGVLDFIEGLLVVVGWMAVMAAACVGFGAVLVTRAGRRPDFYRSDPFDDDPDWDDFPTTPRTPGPTGGDDWFGAEPSGPTATGADDDSGTETGTAGATVADVEDADGTASGEEDQDGAPSASAAAGDEDGAAGDEDDEAGSRKDG